MARIIITSLTTYPADFPPIPPHGWRYIDGSINGIPITIGIPPEIPTTKDDIIAYLISIAPQIRGKVTKIAANLPQINHDIDMEFDYDFSQNDAK